jgi:hypothetical protein
MNIKTLYNIIQYYTMPRNSIDFSKCVIYKICCKDSTITDIYVGHTTDKISRKSSHRSRCDNENSDKYNLYVYQFIRDHGGWDNWSFIVIEEYPCENINQARLRERYWLETLQATLNKVVPSRTKQEWICDNVEQITQYQRKYKEQNRERLNECSRQYREQNKEIIQEKRNENIECECGSKYTKQNQSRHFKSKKHIKYLEQKN